MCYAKKIVDWNDVDLVFGLSGRDLGPKFNGQYDCAKFNCNVSGCNEGFVDGEAPKRN